MASKFGYRLTKRAESDLDGIVSYIAVVLANPQAASDFVDKLQDNIEETRAFPESGSLVHNEFLQVENVRRKLVGNYIMYYLPDMGEKIIYILRIVYGKRNMDAILKKLDIWSYMHLSWVKQKLLKDAIDKNEDDLYFYTQLLKALP